QIRTTQIHPLDEVRSFMAVFDETLFRILPELMRSLDRALTGDATGTRAPRAPRFIRIGSWIGGDRDGNPAVTAAVAADTMEIQAQHILLRVHAHAARRGRPHHRADATT